MAPAPSPADRGCSSTRVRRAPRGRRRPEVAAQQQAYMKSAMPYFGLPAPRLKAELGRCCGTGSRPTTSSGRAPCARSGTRPPTARSGTPPSRSPGTGAPGRGSTPASLDLWEHLVVTGAWWDVVDDVATHLVGDVLAGHRSAATPVVRAWATDDDLWLRRTAVICQIGHQGRHRPRPAAPRHRGQRRRPVVLAAQGDRLGAAPARPDRPGLGPRRGRPAGRPAVRALPARGPQAPADLSTAASVIARAEARVARLPSSWQVVGDRWPSGSRVSTSC